RSKRSRRTFRSNSCASTSTPAGLSVTCMVRPAWSRTSKRRTPYGDPLAPVKAKTRSAAAMNRSQRRSIGKPFSTIYSRGVGTRRGTERMGISLQTGLLVVAVALGMPPTDGDWKLDVLHLKTGRKLQGLIVKESGADILFWCVKRKSGAPTGVI